MVISLQENKFGMEELKTRGKLKSCMQRKFYVPFLLMLGKSEVGSFCEVFLLERGPFREIPVFFLLYLFF